MNGWNSSRPTWDSQDGTGDDAPGFPDRDDYGLQAYGRQDYGQSPYGQPGQQSQPDYNPEDFWARDQAGPGGYDTGANGHNGNNGFSSHNGHETHAPQGFDQGDY